MILSAWATFIIFIFVGVLLTYPLLKNIKLAIFILLGVIALAGGLTFYFCDLALPW